MSDRLAHVRPMRNGKARLVWPPTRAWGWKFASTVITEHESVQAAFAWAIRRGMNPQLLRRRK